MEINYLAVTHNSTILAQYAVDNGDFDVLVNEIISGTEIKNPRIQVDKGGYHFFIFHNDKGLNVVASCSRETEPGDAFGVLESIFRSFIASYANEWTTANAFKYQSSFEPNLRREIEIHSNKKSEPAPITKVDFNLNEDDVQSQYDPEEISNVQTRRSNKKLELFIRRYKWVFLAIIILLIILIILVVLYITTD